MTFILIYNKLEFFFEISAIFWILFEKWGILGVPKLFTPPTKNFIDPIRKTTTCTK